MHHTNGRLPSGSRIDQDAVFNAHVAGDAYVAGWVTLHLNGLVDGNLTIEPGANVEINGTVKGAVINQGADVKVNGHVGSINDTGASKTTVANGAVVG
jgi:hypothetical protein